MFSTDIDFHSGTRHRTQWERSSHKPAVQNRTKWKTPRLRPKRDQKYVCVYLFLHINPWRLTLWCLKMIHVCCRSLSLTFAFVVHEFFYFVLEEVPIGRFKELVRRLGVSEQNIDRAEQDHRNSKDAHYQMLKVWSDSGSGGGDNVLPCHRIQMLVDTLKDMYLVNCADNIESRFLSQDTSTSHWGH